MTYLKLLLRAQLATTREAALEILELAEDLNLLENSYQLTAFITAIK